MRCFVLPALMGFVSIASAQQTASPVAVKVELCDVVRTPSAYSEKPLSLQGIVMGQDPKRTILTGYCQFGVKLKFSSEVESHADVKALFRSILRGNPGTTDRDISGVFTGVFHYDAASQDYYMDVMRVDDLKSPKD